MGKTKYKRRKSKRKFSIKSNVWALPILAAILVVVLLALYSRKERYTPKNGESIETISQGAEKDTKDEVYYEVEPTISPGKLVSPVIKKGFDSYQLTIAYPSNWKVTDSKFYYHKDGIYSYTIRLENINSSYKIGIGVGDSGTSYCLFPDDDLSKADKPSYVRFGEYQTIPSDIGELRMASSLELSTPGKVLYSVCQKSLDDNPNLWVNKTIVGGLGLEVPEQYDPRILQEMKEIVSGIQLQKI